PTFVRLLTTETCVSLCPAFSPEETCDSARLKATAICTSASRAPNEGSNAPVSRCTSTPDGSADIRKAWTEIFGTPSALANALSAKLGLLPTNWLEPSTTICGV